MATPLNNTDRNFLSNIASKHPADSHSVGMYLDSIWLSQNLEFADNKHHNESQIYLHIQRQRKVTEYLMLYLLRSSSLHIVL